MLAGGKAQGAGEEGGRAGAEARPLSVGWGRRAGARLAAWAGWELGGLATNQGVSRASGRGAGPARGRGGAQAAEAWVGPALLSEEQGFPG